MFRILFQLNSAVVVKCPIVSSVNQDNSLLYLLFVLGLNSAYGARRHLSYLDIYTHLDIYTLMYTYLDIYTHLDIYTLI